MWTTNKKTSNRISSILIISPNNYTSHDFQTPGKPETFVSSPRQNNRR